MALRALLFLAQGVLLSQQPHLTRCGRMRSFACGMEEGVQAVLDNDAIPYLLKTLSHHDEKVVEAGARSLKMIYNVSRIKL
jgi:hypothetical protein